MDRRKFVTTAGLAGTAIGVIVSLVAVWYGYSARPTGAGVGTATTNTVVVSSVLVLVFDFIMTSFFT